MNKKILGLVGGASLLMTCASAPAFAVQVVDGDFNIAATGYSLPSTSYFTTVYATSKSNPTAQPIDGWTVTKGSVDWIGANYWQQDPYAKGSLSIDLNGNGPGTISQKLNNLTAGKEYAVTFDFAGNPELGSMMEKGMVSVSPGAGSSIFFNTFGASDADMGWVKGYTLDFLAASSKATLSFAGLNSGPTGIVISNVSVSAVPELSTWAMMALGFAGLGFAGLRSRRGGELAA